MKNFKQMIGALLVAALVFTSCENEDRDDLIIPATAAEFNSIKDQALENITQNFQFNADDGVVTLTSANGVEININGSCLLKNGNAVTGNVDLEFVEIFDKGSMLVTNKPTMGIMPSGDKALLITGGEFFIEATQNGVVLQTTCNFDLIIPGALTGGVDTDMILWKGIIDANGDLAWDEVINLPATTGLAGGRVFGEGNSYYAFLSDFGWSNVDRFYSDPRPKTTILAGVPAGYDNKNCSLFLSYDGEDAGLANLDTFDSVTGLFSEHYGQIPIGLECHVIFVSEENNNWKYAIKPVTIVENGIITFTNSEMSVATEAQLKTLVNNLP